MDAFPRCFARGLRVLKFDGSNKTAEQISFLDSTYKWTVLVVGLGGFALFYFSAASMLKLLQFVTILSFILSPIIAYINLKAIQSTSVPVSHRPSSILIGLAYLGLFSMVGFAIYYLLGVRV